MGKVFVMICLSVLSIASLSAHAITNSVTAKSLITKNSLALVCFQITDTLESLAGNVQGSPRWVLASATGTTLEDAVKIAKQKYKGKVLSAKKIDSKGPLVYKIKMILPDSRVKTIFVDGESGEVIENEL